MSYCMILTKFLRACAAGCRSDVESQCEHQEWLSFARQRVQYMAALPSDWASGSVGAGVRQCTHDMVNNNSIYRYPLCYYLITNSAG